MCVVVFGLICFDSCMSVFFIWCIWLLMFWSWRFNCVIFFLLGIFMSDNCLFICLEIVDWILSWSCVVRLVDLENLFVFIIVLVNLLMFCFYWLISECYMLVGLLEDCLDMVWIFVIWCFDCLGGVMGMVFFEFWSWDLKVWLVLGKVNELF